MTQTDLDLTNFENVNTDTYNIYHCACCGGPYQLAVRQWKGLHEEVQPARNCECGSDCWVCVENTSIREIRKKDNRNQTYTKQRPSHYNMTPAIGIAASFLLSSMIRHSIY